MSASQGDKGTPSESPGPDYGKWDQLWERKASIVGGVLDLLKSLATVSPVLAITDFGLCCISVVMLYYNRNPHGVFGAVVIAALMVFMGMVSVRTSRRQYAEDTKTAADMPLESRNERRGSP